MVSLLFFTLLITIGILKTSPVTADGSRSSWKENSDLTTTSFVDKTGIKRDCSWLSDQIQQARGLGGDAATDVFSVYCSPPDGYRLPLAAVICPSTCNLPAPTECRDTNALVGNPLIGKKKKKCKWIAKSDVKLAKYCSTEPGIRSRADAACPMTCGKCNDGNVGDSIPTSVASSTSSIDNPLDVLVIGAGWSGLAAGNRLIQSGAATKVEILEARDYVGGRSRTMENYFVDGLPTEMGSAWIYGGGVTGDIYRSAGLKSTPTDFDLDNMLLYTSRGRIPDDEADKLKTRYKAGWVKWARKNKDVDVSLRSLIDTYFAQEGLTQQPGGPVNIDRQVINALVHVVVNTEAGSPFVERGSDFCCYVWDYSIDYTAIPGGGYKNAVEAFATPFMDKIRLNTVVQTVDYSIEGVVKVSAKDLATNIVHDHFARAVVVTLPLGVLQNRDVTFLPALSPERLEAIDVIGNGVVNKAIVYWDQTKQDVSSWWPYGQVDFQLITDQDADSEEWTWFINDQAHEGNEANYILTAWSGGTATRYLEKEDDEKTKARIVANLRKMFGPDVPEPAKILVTRWGSDPFARGAHTFNRVGVSTSIQRRILREPLDRKVFWAGQATAGETTSAAFRSGNRAASEVETALFP